MRAFALGGGGGKIGFSAGAVYRLNKKRIKPHFISGISSGTLVGAMVATDQLELMKKLILEEVTNEMIYEPVGKIKYFWRLGLHKIGLRNPVEGFYDNQPLKDLLYDVLYGKGVCCHFYVGVVDANTGKFHNVFIPKGSIMAGSKFDWWLHAITASTAIPIKFKPVDYNGMKLIDGGVRHNTPFEPLRRAIKHEDVDEIYAISMLEPSVEQRNDIKDDIDLSAMLVRNMIEEQANREIKNYQLINEVAQKMGGKFEAQGKIYRHYHGAVLKPTQKLNSSFDFNHKNMRADWVHGEDQVENI